MKRQRGKVLFLFFALLGIFSCGPSPEGFIILCAGDSITNSPYPRYLRRMLQKEELKARVIQFGKDGHTSGEYLRFLLENKDLMEKEFPDFILLQLGTNDVRIDHDNTSASLFYENMKKIVAVFRKFQNRKGQSPQILLATVPPVPVDLPFPFSPESAERVEKEINPTIQKICLEEQLPLVDNFTLFARFPQLIQDVHPTKEGYRRMAENWLLALKPLFHLAE